jgi:hypothetical protein
MKLLSTLVKWTPWSRSAAPETRAVQGLVAAGPARQNVPLAAQTVRQAASTNPPEPAFPGVPFLTRQVAPPFR